MTAELMRDLTNNAAPLLALVIVHAFLLPRLQRNELPVLLLMGLLFGATAVIGMAFPFEMRSGLIFDGRSVVLCLAGFFGGPLVAAPAAVLAGAYRYSIGGPGVWMGLGVILTSSLIGLIGHRLVRAGQVRARSMTFLSLGLFVHLCSLLWMLALPDSLRSVVIRDIALPFLGVLTLSTWMFGFGFQLAVDRKHALDATAEAERRFRDLVEGSLVGVFLIQRGRLIYGNPALDAIFGFERGVVGHSPREMIAPREYQRATAMLRAALRGGRSIVGELIHMQRADGREFAAEIFVRGTRRDGRPVLVGMLLDVSERERAAGQLARSERLLREAQQAADMGSYALEFSSMRWTASEALDRLAGLPADYPRTLEGWVGLIVPEQRQAMAEYYQSMLTAGDRFDREYAIVRPSDGERRWIHGIGSIERDAAGQPLRMVGTVQDITPRKQAELAAQESEHRFRGLFAAIPDLVWLKDPDGAYLACNPAFERLFGAREADIVGRTDFDLVDRVQAERFRQQDLDVFAAGRPVRYEETLAVPGEGRSIALETIKTPLYREDGSLTGVLGIARDVSERRQLLDRLRLDSAVIASTAESIIVTDMASNIVAVNQSFTAISGYAEDEVLGHNVRLLQSGRHDEAFYGAMFRSLRESGHWQGEVWNRRKSGELYPELLNISVVRDGAGKPTHYVGVGTDITQLKRSEDQLQHLAHHDTLTGLPNRLLVRLRLEHALERARREAVGLAVLFLDLDRFKTVNDSLGHEVGDQLLIAVAQRLRELLREEDTLGRLGGDEFLVLLDQCSNATAAAKVAEKFIAAFSAPFALPSGHELFVQASIGISLHPADGDRVDTLIRNADSAMFRAKEQGRNSYQFYTEALTQAASSRLKLEQRIRRGITAREFMVWYQPIYSVSDARIVGAEALLRWANPDGTMMPPDQFVPVAEDCGLIVELGRQVLERCCVDLRAWLDRGLAVHTVAVNLSAQQFRSGHLERMVAEVVARARIPAQMLELEITERGLMDLGEHTLDKLRAIRALGVRLAIDDFGTGYSSLGYLKRMPVDKLKIDRSFVDHLPHDDNDAAIVNSIIAIARALKLKVLAEGVENRAQLRFLADAACDECQGFLFGPAVPAERFAELLQRQQREAVA